MKIVISQPMFFPWIGIFEQINLCDIYVHLDDVKLPGGCSFMNRVQLKGPGGAQWWTLPISRSDSFSNIKEVGILLTAIWIKKSQKTLEQILSGLPYKDDAVGFFVQALGQNFSNLAEFNIFVIEEISQYLGLHASFKKVDRSPFLEDKTENLISILKKEAATEYISGLGGMGYIRRDLFDFHNIQLKFMNYQNKPYYQKFGNFDPYVSILHPIAAMGKDAKKLLVSTAENTKNLK